jgi:Fe-S oxidoreductase
LFRQIKIAADPHNLLNPGKILDAPPMDTNLRYGGGYQANEWRTVMDYSRQGSLSGAIEMCNGAGVCRKEDGVMCPSFQVTRDEMHSTRGRANLLRAMISGKFPTDKLAETVVYQALDLCLACKGCKAECPSAVDMAKLRYEFANQYYKKHRRKLRDYLFGYIGRLAPLGSFFAPLTNKLLGSVAIRKILQQTLDLDSRRKFPSFASLRKIRHMTQSRNTGKPEVLFLTDSFSHYFHPETEAAGRRALEMLGLQVQVIPVMGTGRTLISKGFLEIAKQDAVRLLETINQLDPEGLLPVVGVEPSEVATLRDEFLDFFPGDEKVKKLARRAWMVDEFLIRPGKDGTSRISRINRSPDNGRPRLRVLLHGHCYQKAQPPAEDGYPTGVPATVAMLESLGYQVEVANSGCCGMAGAFGYEHEHYEISMKVGELSLFPAVRQSNPDIIVAASGTSCRSQIEDGTGKVPVHPVCLINPIG